MNEIKLKPCPFCGGEAVLWDREVVGYGKIVLTWQVFCKDCGIRTPHFYTRKGVSLQMAKHSAIEAWNKRVRDAP